jgi:hypothetical protein
MNLHTLLVSARKLLTVTAVTLVAATCLGSAATSTSAAAGHDRSDSTSAAKESSTVTSFTAAVSKTKEW